MNEIDQRLIKANVHTPRQSFLIDHVVSLLRLAAIVSIVSGLVGGFLWMANLADLDDGDDMRWGFLHNPFMQFRLFNETFLLISLWVMFVCSAAIGAGGILLLVPLKGGAWLVTWQARVSIVIHGVVVFFIIAMTFGFGMMPWEKKALACRLGAIAVDLSLWAFLSSRAVVGYFARQSNGPGQGFDVIVRETRVDS